MEFLAKLSLEDINNIMSQPQPLHRYVAMMSGYFHDAVQHIKHTYSGDASLIWSNKPSSAEVIYRFLRFKGVGPKIASMAVNILARDFKIRFNDYTSIDISADVHVRRVFARLGLCESDPSVDQVIYKARALHPEFPGIIDFTCWEIGRNYCNVKKPVCNTCYMQELCMYSNRI